MMQMSALSRLVNPVLIGGEGPVITSVCVAFANHRGDGEILKFLEVTQLVDVAQCDFKSIMTFRMISDCYKGESAVYMCAARIAFIIEVSRK